MADNNPNYKIEQQRIVLQILEQEAAMAKTLLETMELVDRIDKNKTNMKATDLAVANIVKEQAEAKTAIEKQRKKSQMAGLVANVERQTLENLEMEERANQMIERSKSETTAKNVFVKQLASLTSAHGEPTKETVETLVAKLANK